MLDLCIFPRVILWLKGRYQTEPGRFGDFDIHVRVACQNPCSIAVFICCTERTSVRLFDTNARLQCKFNIPHSENLLVIASAAEVPGRIVGQCSDAQSRRLPRNVSSSFGVVLSLLARYARRHMHMIRRGHQLNIIPDEAKA